MPFREKAFWAGWVLAFLFILGSVAHAVTFFAPNGIDNGAKYVNPAPAAPKIPTKITLAGAASAGTTLATAGQCLRISCTVDCAYRITTGASTAVTDDNQLPAATPERVCMGPGQDTITVFSASAGAAYVASVVP